jgi:hypothetical protein
LPFMTSMAVIKYVLRATAATMHICLPCLINGSKFVLHKLPSTLECLLKLVVFFDRLTSQHHRM